MTNGAQVDVWWATLTSADIALAGCLTAAESRRLEGLGAGAAAGRFLVGSALLRIAAADRRGCKAGEIELTRTCPDCGEPHGRPVVAGGPHLSLSHAGVLVVVAAADVPVGVDLERVEDGADPGERRRRDRWVVDEAVLKAGDEGALVALEAPLPGYTGALAVVAPAPPTVRHRRATEPLARLRREG